jgi:hypothetical protein
VVASALFPVKKENDRMEKIDIDGFVAEYSLCATSSEDTGLRIVEAALFVEECFGLRLDDRDFSPENLGSPAAITRFLRDRIGV